MLVRAKIHAMAAAVLASTQARLLRVFARSTQANVAMIFALSLVPLTVGAGVGLDLARAMLVRSQLSEALDASALAVAGTSGLSAAAQKTMAQQYFNANYKGDPSYGTPSLSDPVVSGQSIKLTATDTMPTTILNAVGYSSLTITESSTVVWGQQKLWVALVLDNTGSMTQTDSSGLSKISALKSASHSLLTMLQNASTTAGDVRVAIVPFAKDVKAGTSYAGSTWIDWTDWSAAPPNSTPSGNVGPGSNCPYGTNTSPYGYACNSTSVNDSANTSTIPSSGTYKGYICPDMDNGRYNTANGGHYYNGCYNSVPTQTYTTTAATPSTLTSTATCTSTSTGTCKSGTTTTNSTATGSTTTTNATTSGYTGDSTTTTSNTANPVVGSPVITSTGFGSNKVYTKTIVTTTVTTSTTVTKTGVGPYSHTWIANDHSNWTGCFMDRTQNYDAQNTLPATSTPATLFPAENSSYCPVAALLPLGYDWTALSNEIDAMVANGSTNQTIGLAWGWQALTSGDPLGAPSRPANTQQVIILLSDGLNTQDRWYGDGSNQSTSVDNRMAAACANAKTAGATIYTVFVDLGGTQGNSTVLQSCATDTTKYFDLTTSAQITTAFNTIGQQITNLRVSQ